MQRAAFLLGALFGLTACAGQHEPALHGTVLRPPKLAPPIALTSQTGRPFSLARARGAVVALYFGYTHCTDVCPQTLVHLGTAAARSGLAAHAVRIVFVSVDPRRDTPAALRAFFAKTGVSATGLTGTRAQLAPVWKAYGVAVEPQGAQIGHSSYIYLIDARGYLREVLDASTPIAAIADDLRAIAG